MSHTRTLNYKKYNSAFLHMGPHDDLPDSQRKRTSQDPAIPGICVGRPARPQSTGPCMDRVVSMWSSSLHLMRWTRIQVSFFLSYHEPDPKTRFANFFNAWRCSNIVEGSFRAYKCTLCIVVSFTASLHWSNERTLSQNSHYFHIIGYGSSTQFRRV